eukprot:CAMPEP_0197290924 /NCGR_PEP_ID=MMETSP0890-20130614/10317_1 /TAXON_ID=44058 ORGANISM="Aureoumbra lagunensis, Strain CCMP1510" /NCGR_SAMPLE_ID=MMETSP0890 /ASSEMBLY_ACC=CAM_ASM_000533 /LENGTH=210 /DNA_ID=CAMNT_0042763301 /DNA_START=67 /DNA_END=699 /DNA_ORIENTATION=-
MTQRVIMALMLLLPSVTAFTRPSRVALPRTNRVAGRRIVMEDFGILKGTPFSFGNEWQGEDAISEVKLEKYLNKEGLRYKMNKTEKERAGLKLFDGPEIKFTIPILNVDVNITPPEVESIWEALGFAATSNNEARQNEKRKAIAKEKEAEMKYKDLLDFWKDKYGYQKYVPGTWFYADQLSTDADDLKATSGFRMRKGGYYLDGTKDTRK